MNSIKELSTSQFPSLLQEIDDPPKRLYIRGELPGNENIFLTVVGARRHSEYAKEATEMLIESLKGLPVVIVSGLAFGIDAIAHRAALRTGLRTIAVPGSGLDEDVIYPAAHHNLAKEILAKGGCLISPFENDVKAAPWTFPVRNRVMAGMSHATLVIEAEIKSGTLITSKFATEFNRNVFTVPGSIFDSRTAGPHMLIRLGATPITTGGELIEALGFKADAKRETIDYSDLSPEELKIVEILSDPMPRDELFERLAMETSKVSALISLLEIKGVIEEKLGELRRV
jgi:DNA processing protein